MNPDTRKDSPTLHKAALLAINALDKAGAALRESGQIADDLYAALTESERALASAPPPQLTWVKQEDVMGCVPACLAMLTGKTYKEVANFLIPKLGWWDGAEYRIGISNFSEHGVEMIGQGLRFLTDNGYAVQQKNSSAYANYDQVANWPPAPWAPAHLCMVSTSQSHAVVMLADGTVLDPLSPEPRRLSDYSAVQVVIGVFRVAAPSVAQPPRPSVDKVAAHVARTGQIPPVAPPLAQTPFLCAVCSKPETDAAHVIYECAPLGNHEFAAPPRSVPPRTLTDIPCPTCGSKLLDNTTHLKCASCRADWYPDMHGKLTTAPSTAPVQGAEPDYMNIGKLSEMSPEAAQAALKRQAAQVEAAQERIRKEPEALPDNIIRAAAPGSPTPPRRDSEASHAWNAETLTDEIWRKMYHEGAYETVRALVTEFLSQTAAPLEVQPPTPPRVFTEFSRETNCIDVQRVAREIHEVNCALNHAAKTLHEVCATEIKRVAAILTRELEGKK